VVDSKPVVRQNIMATEAYGRHYPPHMGRKKREQKEPGLTFKGTPPVTYFLQLGPTS
jgi:hypothetical protein